MAEIKITHQGFDITFAENENIWRCWKLNIENENLSKLKQKINKHISVALKTMNIDCAVLDKYGVSCSNDIQRGKIISRDARTGEFWVVKGANERRERVDGKFLRPWSSEIEDKIASARALHEEARRYNREATVIIQSIKPLSQEQHEAFLASLLTKVEDDAD